MIFSCPECQYSQENEPFELCPNCVKKELAELKADLVAAHAHIQHLHGMILGTDNPSPLGLLCAVINWEDDQCPF